MPEREPGLPRTRWRLGGRPVRSLLIVAGDALDGLQAPGADLADLWVLDLEDMVPEEHRDTARAEVAAALRQLEPQRLERTLVRLSTCSDAGALAPEVELAASCAGAIVPKVETLASARAIGAQLCAARVGPPPLVILTLETPVGVLRAPKLLSSGDLVQGALFGPSDLARSLGLDGADRTAGLAHARAHVVLCAAATGVAAIDGGWVQENDLAGLARDAATARTLGYDAKLTTFSQHVAELNAVFAEAGR